MKFTVDSVREEDLQRGKLNTSWSLRAQHHSFKGDNKEAESYLKTILIGMLLSILKGMWDGSDEWNHLLPEHQFDRVEPFLSDIWRK